MTLAAAGMVALGLWQLDRYHHRSAINARIDGGIRRSAVAPDHVLPAPTGPAGTVGVAPPASAGWQRVVVTGRYDPAHEILARGRTVNGRVGFEVITPLTLADGSSVLVDRGWVPPAEGGAGAAPNVPATPTGEVTVVGRVHQPESGARPPDDFGGRLVRAPHRPEAAGSGPAVPDLRRLPHAGEPDTAGRSRTGHDRTGVRERRHERRVRRAVVGVRHADVGRARLSDRA